MSFNRKQLSLLITFFSMSIIVLLTYTIKLGGNNEEQEFAIEMSLADEDLEELLEEEEKRLEEIAANTDPIKSHLAYNQTAKPKIGNPEPLQTLEELREERAANQSSSDMLSSNSGYGESLKELAEKREEKKKELGDKESQKKEFTNTLKDFRTSITFSLLDRMRRRIPTPTYTCIETGKVVINIDVNSSGDVISAVFNSNSSTTSNGCLVDNAIKYAKKATFNSSSKSSQKGTITYLYVRK